MGGEKERLLEVWRESGLSMSQFAKDAGINKATVSRSQSEDGPGLSRKTLDKVAETYGISKQWLYDGTGPKKKGVVSAQPSMGIAGETVAEKLLRYEMRVQELERKLEEKDVRIAELEEKEHGNTLFLRELALKKPEGDPEAAFFLLPSAAPISLRPTACVDQPQAEGRQVSMLEWRAKQVQSVGSSVALPA